MAGETDLGAGEFLDAAGNRMRRDFDSATGAWHTQQVDEEGGNVVVDAPSWQGLAEQFLQPHMQEWVPVLLKEMARRLDDVDEDRRERVASARRRLFEFREN